MVKRHNNVTFSPNIFNLQLVESVDIESMDTESQLHLGSMVYNYGCVSLMFAHLGLGWDTVLSHPPPRNLQF